VFIAYFVVAVLAIAATAFSGVVALAHFKPILAGMAKAGVPESWLTFPIGKKPMTVRSGRCRLELSCDGRSGPFPPSDGTPRHL
jgi:hypothetical protein